MEGILVLVVLIALSVLPGIIASIRGHHQAVAIWLTTIIFGWTGIGWLIALIWAATAINKPQPINVVVNNAKE